MPGLSLPSERVCNPDGGAMGIEELAAQIATVPTVAGLDEIARTLWAGLGAGEIGDAEAEAVSRAIEARRGAIRGRAAIQAAVDRKAAQGPSLWLWARAEDRARSIGRRRRLAASGPLPPALAARFTTGELAVLRIVGDECRRAGTCDKTLGEVAARAGVGRTTAQRALRVAAMLGMIRVTERRRPYQRSLPNLVTVISAEWRAWLDRGPHRGDDQAEGGRVRKGEPHGYEDSKSDFRGGRAGRSRPADPSRRAWEGRKRAFGPGSKGTSGG